MARVKTVAPKSPCRWCLGRLSGRLFGPLRLLQLLVFVCGTREAVATEWTPRRVSSPNGRLEATLWLAPNHELEFGLRRDDETLILRSRLRLKERSSTAKLRHLQTTDGPSFVNDDYSPPWGPRQHEPNRYRELRLGLSMSALGLVDVHLRVFNDGLGLRYVFRERTQQDVREETAFRIPGNPLVWFTEGWKDVGGPVRLNQLRTKLVTQPDFGKDATTPITMRLSASSLLVFHEADLVDSPGVTPRQTAEDTLRLDARHGKRGQSEFATAWRTIMVAESAARLAESSLIRNLNPPMRSIVSVHGRRMDEWVRPGLSMWEFRVRGAVDPADGFTYGADYETMVRFIDFAAEARIPYVLLDDGWYRSELEAKSGDLLNLEIINVRNLARYAKQRGVGLILYVDFEALRRMPDLEFVLRTYHEWGAAGIKHGFATNARSNVVHVYQEMLRTIALCAKYELVYCVHEPPKPSGWERTFPNMLATEYTDSMLDNPRRRATRAPALVTLPFVHHLVAPVDRSSGMFGLDNYITRTKCHRQLPSTVMSQLAQGFLFPTGLWTLVDSDYNYRAKPALLALLAEMDGFLRAEQTWAQGTIGEELVMTKKLGNTYLTCGLTASSRMVTVSLEEVLPRDVTFDVTLFHDGPADGAISTAGPEIPTTAEKRRIAADTTKRELFEIVTSVVNSADPVSLRVRVANGGGFCARLVSREDLNPITLAPTKTPTTRPSVAPTAAPAPRGSAGVYCATLEDERTCEAQRCKWEGSRCEELMCVSKVSWRYTGDPRVADGKQGASVVHDFRWQHESTCPDLPFATYDYPAHAVEGAAPRADFDSQGSAAQRLASVTAPMQTPFTVDVSRLSDREIESMCLTAADCRHPPQLSVLRRASDGALWRPEVEGFAKRRLEKSNVCCDVNQESPRNAGFGANYFTIPSRPPAATHLVADDVEVTAETYFPSGTTAHTAKVVRLDLLMHGEELYTFVDLTCRASRDLYRRSSAVGPWRGRQSAVALEVVFKFSGSRLPQVRSAARTDRGFTATKAAFGDRGQHRSLGKIRASFIGVSTDNIAQRQGDFAWVSLDSLSVVLKTPRYGEMVGTYLMASLEWAMVAPPKGNWPLALLNLLAAQRTYNRAVRDNEDVDFGAAAVYTGQGFENVRRGLEFLVERDGNGVPRFMKRKVGGSRCMQAFPRTLIKRFINGHAPAEASCLELSRNTAAMQCSTFCSEACEPAWRVLQRARALVWDELINQVPKCADCPGLIGLMQEDVPPGVGSPLEQSTWYPQCLPFIGQDGETHTQHYAGKAMDLPDYASCDAKASR